MYSSSYSDVVLICNKVAVHGKHVVDAIEVINRDVVIIL